MADRTGMIALHGNALTLTGTEIKVGDKAPNVTLTGNDLAPVELASFQGKVVILSTVPSLDTPTCDTETRTFNQKAAGLGADIVILTASLDLPFAQKRWCGAAGVDKVTTLSDYREAALGKAFGVLIKELHLLARAIFVLDRRGVVQYIQLVPEVSQEPDYEAALATARKLL
ncbi:MAG: thiol peroxidase [Myxococcales bacterium]|nr:thiol peroxidase [Myxococcales bacterium]